MCFSPLSSPNCLSHSPPSPKSSRYSASSSGTGSPNSSHVDLNSPQKKFTPSHLLSQACPFASSSLTSLTHGPNLAIVTLPPVAQCGPGKPPFGYSPPSQPSEPINFLKTAANATTPAALFKLLQNEPFNVLLFDIRSERAYEAGYIHQAINVPVPMERLKKTTFTIYRMIADYILDEDLEKVARWNQVSHIIAYDNDRDGQSGTAGSAAFYLLEKFIQEGWEGQTYVLRGEYNQHPLHGRSTKTDFGIIGGIKGFAEEYPGMIQEIPSIEDGNSPGALAYANQGDILRDWKLSSEKFLPRNRDSWDKVDEIAITLPLDMGENAISLLPTWLLNASKDGGSRLVAEKFRFLEMLQGRRLNGTYKTAVPGDILGSFQEDPSRYRLAGSGAGAKNRYRDIYPYEHSRVKLLDFEDDDYINASHLSVQNSPKNYISSQAPMPAAFNDFWKMIWEQDVRFIVVLTAMEEVFRTVAHRYWAPGNYGPLKLTCVSEKMILLNDIPLDAWQGEGKPKPIMHYISVRRFTLEHRAHPFFTIRGITQIQDLAWPDFGVPDDPGHILRIINYMNQVIAPIPPMQYLAFGYNSPFPRTLQSPIVVQCSAGCGRSGVFCTVDAIIDQLERHLTQQELKKKQEKTRDNSVAGNTPVDIRGSTDCEEGGRYSDREDLIEKVVSRFRDERMSVVQNLRQYIHCYEVTLEWFRARYLEGGDDGKGDWH